jgi:hypothetical protein
MTRSPTKICRNCSVTITAGENWRNCDRKSRHNICIDCARAKSRQWAADNREAYNAKMRDINARWRKANRDKASAAVKKWGDAHPEKLAEYKQRRRDKTTKDTPILLAPFKCRDCGRKMQVGVNVDLKKRKANGRICRKCINLNSRIYYRAVKARKEAPEHV